MKIEKGGVVYYLDRGAYNVNDPEALAVKMDIIEKTPSFGEFGLYAHAKQGYFTLEFEVTEEQVSQLTRSEFPCLFETREAALEQYNKEQQGHVDNIMNMSQEDLLKKFFQAWHGEDILDTKIHNAMIEKIKKEFGVDVSH